ncbi:MAG: NAD(P)-dependent oxidoreductase, partial [Bacteroidetes bacterium]|nr:NAD(P)-dependent oxidoreductase [Bacteroidota bacterium]
YLHIDDCVTAIVKMVGDDSLSGIYNVIGEAKYTVKELISLIEKRFNMEYRTEFMQVSPWENVEDLSAAKLKEATSFQPSWHLSEFIEKELER